MEKFVLNKSEVLANPHIEAAEAMVERVRGYDEIVSIGGGSTIDVAKYVAWKLKIPHKAIPTTAGTGSEVTKFAVFVRDGKKFSIEDDALIPDSYELKPELVVSLPAIHTAASGLDALSQAIESYWSPLSTYESRGYSKKTIDLVMSSLLGSYKNPENKELRRNMLVAANYSGRAINITRTSVCHAISYPLTTHYDIPHGIACAITLPIFMKLFGFKVVSVGKVKRLIADLGIDRVEMLKKITDEIKAEAMTSERATKNVPFKVNLDKVLC